MSQHSPSAVRSLFLAVVVCATAGMLLPTLCAAEPEITARVSPKQIYLGESVRYGVTIESSDVDVEPELEASPDFDVQLKHKTASLMSTIIINGRTQSRTQSPTYVYVLTPRRAGPLSLPIATATIGGKPYRGPTVMINVLDPEQQDMVVLEMSASRDRVYPLQRFDIKLNVAVKSLPDPHSEQDPLSVLRRRLPQLNISWVNDGELPEGIKAVQPAADWLSSYVQNRQGYGFGINEVATNGRSTSGGGFGGLPGFPDLNRLFDDDSFPDFDSMFSRMSESNRAAFRPPSRRTVRTDKRGSKTGYWEYTFKRTFTAEKLGSRSFGPVTLDGIFATRASGGGGLEGERFYAMARPVRIEVQDAPRDGRPDTYIGAIGQFDVSAELNPKRVKVGDPLTLAISLRGEGTLDTTTAPKLETVAAIADGFKVYEATEETVNGSRRFTYSLRPRRTGISEFPPVPMTYFDVSDEKYVTLQTAPLGIEVAAADTLSQQDIAMAEIPSQPVAGPELRIEGVFANITDVSQLTDETIPVQVWMFVVACLAGAYVAVRIASSVTLRRRADVAGQRKRRATRRAHQRLCEAQPHIAAQSARQAADGLSGALAGLIADAAAADEQGWTSGDVLRHAQDLSLEPQLVTRLSSVLEHCDAARYGAWQKPLDSLSQEARGLLDDLAQALRRRKLVS